MSSISNVQGLFKKYYGDLKDLVPEGGAFDKKMPMDTRKRVGESYVEAVILSAETGLTLAGQNAEVLDIQPPVAGAVKQAAVKDYATLVASTIPFQTLSRSAERGDQAFVSASQHVTKNNLKSHKRFLEAIMVHGQSDGKLGYVSYATDTYRGVSLTNGAGTLNGVAFTAGVNTSSKHIHLHRSFAAGIWVGMEGLPINQLDSNDNIVASGKLVSVNAEYGYIEVDFTPVAATSATSHTLAYPGMESDLEAPGIQKILTNSGTLFEISAATYSLWKGTEHDVSNAKFDFDELQDAIAAAVNRGGLDGDVTCFVNPRTWSTLLQDEAGQRRHTGQMKGGEVKVGADNIRFYGQAGSVEVVPSTMCKENEAYILNMESWYRFGSADLSFKVPGANDDLIFPLQNQTGFAFRSYASQCVFCCMPAKSIYVKNIDDEA